MTETPFTPELGQAIFSNSPWSELEMQPQVEAGLSALGALVSGGDWGADPTVNTGASFENDVFALRSYCWCDGGAAGHEEGCPPNFEHKGEPHFTASWYKHVARGASQERLLAAEEWRTIFAACVNSLAAASSARTKEEA